MYVCGAATAGMASGSGEEVRGAVATGAGADGCATVAVGYGLAGWAWCVGRSGRMNSIGSSMLELTAIGPGTDEGTWEASSPRCLPGVRVLSRGISTLIPQYGQIPFWPARNDLTFSLCPLGQ